MCLIPRVFRFIAVGSAPDVSTIEFERALLSRWQVPTSHRSEWLEGLAPDDCSRKGPGVGCLQQRSISLWYSKLLALSMKKP